MQSDKLLKNLLRSLNVFFFFSHGYTVNVSAPNEPQCRLSSYLL